MNENKKSDQLDELAEFKNISVQALMSLEELTSYLAKVHCVISTDTGVCNLAIAIHNPPLGYFIQQSLFVTPH